MYVDYKGSREGGAGGAIFLRASLFKRAAYNTIKGEALFQHLSPGLIVSLGRCVDDGTVR